MSMSAVEVDLPPTENNFDISPKPQKLLDRRRSFRDIQSGISKINPQLLKSLIASGSSPNPSESPSEKSYSVPSTPKEHPNSYPAYPIYIPTFRPSSTSETGGPETAAVTIFYNGTVSVFQVPPHQAENILKLAQEAGGGSQSLDESTTDSKLAVSSGVKQQLLETLNRDLPIARRKSLQRFFEKRKERLTVVSPYECTTTKQASSGQNRPAVVPKD